MSGSFHKAHYNLAFTFIVWWSRRSVKVLNNQPSGSADAVFHFGILLDDAEGEKGHQNRPGFRVDDTDVVGDAGAGVVAGFMGDGNGQEVRNPAGTGRLTTHHFQHVRSI